ncbi:UDP-glucose:undecaprenyl-phosphate glucose-1-phosphate transferase [Symmachiella macrocystis]|uniref:UDP-glucose:undecaprenyl-phosphate glucose-1-phosphate transferase n=1 Tax=Symmachiella macrocystis TaxID=2527985 RepID=A0A5C6BKJ4_9PLAN|nr:sugar transferase [Symmachiella macrocystis]TWU12618.1 UDP-glucose:undecaprenyl-phosphate glucose-1-phosphate transferase [Symmachiella macrocystis]
MMKRMFDLLVSFCGLLLLWPVLLVSAVLIKLTSAGPALYRQQRMGLNFQSFDILKFRTMVVDAHKLGGQITAGRDPRITSVGHFLRKTKIDELPQLINVFKGEMSFVGPRPEVPRYVEMFRDDYAELLKVRPGITDIASLKYRHESELLGESENPETTYVQEILPDKIVLAKEYIRRSSILFDLKLIFKTVLRMAE